jgi:hypothetical protein
MPGYAAAELAAAIQGVRAQERKRMRLPGASVFLFPHHAERRGRSGRTRALPPDLYAPVSAAPVVGVPPEMVVLFGVGGSTSVADGR